MNIDPRNPDPKSRWPEIEYGVVTGSDTVRLEIELPGPVERVWEYLTDSEKRGKWLAAGPMELREGGSLELRWHHANLSSEKNPPDKYKKHSSGHVSTGKVLRCEPPNLLVFTWDEDPENKDGDNESEVTFELTPRGDRVLFTITHRRLGNRDMMIGVSGGWHAHVLILLDKLDGREPRGFWSTFNRLEEEYRRRIS